MKLRRIFLYGAIGLAVTVGVVHLFRVPISLAVASKFAAKRMAMNTQNELVDGLHVGLCGAGSPFPDDKRSGPCTVVVAGKHLLVFDAGSGAARNVGKMGFNLGRVQAIFLTHFHSDHIDGLGEMMLQRWVTASNKAPVPVYGATGVDQVVNGLVQTYQQDQHYRVTHHGDATMPASGFGGTPMPFAPEADKPLTVLKDGDLEVIAFAVDHGPVHPAIGYRIQYKGRSVLISGDTKKSATVQREAQGVDLLLHEALSTPLMAILKDGATQANRGNLVKIFDDILNYHTSPEEAAEIARDAKVGYLLYNHIAPPLPLRGMADAFVGKADTVYTGPIRVGEDGDFISLPAGSKAIEHRKLF